MRRESLRLVELVALTPRCLPVVWSFLIHLPGALRSTGITRLHRSYGSSDSCQAAVWRLAGLIASWTEPSDRSVSKHPPSSRSLGLHSTNGRAAESGFLEADTPTEQGNAGVLWLRHWTVGSPRRKTESSSSPTDRSFTSWCSPPPLTRTQFRSVTTARPAADRDSHPADSIHSQSHRPTPHGVGLGQCSREALGGPVSAIRCSRSYRSPSSPSPLPPPSSRVQSTRRLPPWPLTPRRRPRSGKTRLRASADRSPWPASESPSPDRSVQLRRLEPRGEEVDQRQGHEVRRRAHHEDRHVAARLLQDRPYDQRDQHAADRPGHATNPHD